MLRKSFIKGSGLGNSKQQDLSLLNKVNNKKSAPKVIKGNNVMNLIEEIKIKVNKHLGKYKDHVKSIRSESELVDYIDKLIKIGISSLDTETTGLDCLKDEIVGTCLYAPGLMAVYIPHKHRSYITGQYLQNQISYDFMREQLQRVKDAGIRVIMHNAKFDKRIINSNMGVDLDCYWDTMLAAKLLDNREDASLKYQYSTHVANEDKTYDFSKLFSGIEYAMVPVETAALYAATDPLITYELYEYQVEEFKKYPGIYQVFTDIEMKVLPVVADMENNGVKLDLEKAKELSVKYHAFMEKAEKDVYAEVDKYKSQIMSYMSKFPACKLSNPINIGSPTQLAILLYDIIRVDVVDNKKPRGTGEEILEKINLPLCKAILKYREIAKLLSTYIDKLPTVVNSNTGRIHASFNQIGADTGRFSSSDPNLQNIPSHNDEIRTMFCAGDRMSDIVNIDNSYTVKKEQEVLTTNGWKFVSDIKVGDILQTDTIPAVIKDIKLSNNEYTLFVR